MSDTKDRIQSLIEDNKGMLFMKGSKEFPQCGFSHRAVQVLHAVGLDFETFNVLEDAEIRQGIKEFSSWPTIPQFYLNGEFVGGSDILIEMFNSGDLQKKVEGAE